jgi:cell wall-associated NlpC family hydrolase
VIALVGAPLAVVGFVTAAVFAIGAAIPTTHAQQGTATAASASGAVSDSPAGAVVVAYARAQLGKPYQWGGAGPDAFDCSGLTQAAWRAAGVAIARTSEQQWQTLPHISLDELLPGDLVFFNSGEFRPGLPGHVGIYIGASAYIDAPHTGAVIRVDQLNHALGLVGAARTNAVPLPAPGSGHRPADPMPLPTRG